VHEKPELRIAPPGDFCPFRGIVRHKNFRWFCQQQTGQQSDGNYCEEGEWFHADVLSQPKATANEHTGAFHVVRNEEGFVWLLKTQQKNVLKMQQKDCRPGMPR
jgi:hypothetical protein